MLLNKKMFKSKLSERVITAWDIARLHGRDVREVNQQFNRNIKNLIENEDYFIVNRSHIFESHRVIQDFIPNNVKEIVLFTEYGYLLLVKTFTDDKSWKVQRQLVKSYFKLKELKEKVEAGELEIKKVNSEIQSNNNQLEQLKSIENIITAYKNAESKPEKLMIIEMVAQMTGNKNKFGYGMADGATSELRKVQ